MTTYPLWEGNAPGANTEIPRIEAYIPTDKTSTAAVLILPGGAYTGRAPHEGAAFAEHFNALGLSAFVLCYRVAPARFPDPLLDARRAMRYLRANATALEIDPDRIAVIGSSAGGHLAAFLSTYHETIAGEGVDAIDALPYLPNAQILCYPVISSDEAVSHAYSYKQLLGERYDERAAFSPELLVTEGTPRAFIWHTAEDAAVNVINSYRYATALREHNISSEMHIFPYGPHGLGLANNDAHVAQWVDLLSAWLRLSGFLPAEA